MRMVSELPLSYMYNHNKLMKFILDNEEPGATAWTMNIGKILDNQKYGGDGIVLLSELSKKIELMITDDIIELRLIAIGNGQIQLIPNFIVPPEVDLSFTHDVRQVNELLIHENDKDTLKEKSIVQSFDRVRSLHYYRVSSIFHKIKVVGKGNPEEIKLWGRANH